MNPNMKEVVKKEVIKWLDAGTIFPISDSNWVSPVQCVPKKGGMVMVKKITMRRSLQEPSQAGEFAWTIVN